MKPFLAAFLFGGLLQAQEQVHRIPSPVPGLRLLLRQASPDSPRSPVPVLILHGATFASASAAAWRQDGVSWMDALRAEGREAWTLDFLGHGGSDRYPEMDHPPIPDSPLGDLDGLVAQVARAVDHIRKITHGAQVDLVAHSAGTLVAGRYAELHPRSLHRLVLFGAPGPRESRPVEPWPSYFTLQGEDQWKAWEAPVKTAGRWRREAFEAWAKVYLASDGGRGAVRVPSGLMACVSELERTGRLPYHPEALSLPTLVILGEWDVVTPLPQALEIFRRLPSPEKRLTVIGQGGHRMHLEASRRAFFMEVNAFLQAGDNP